MENYLGNLQKHVKNSSSSNQGIKVKMWHNDIDHAHRTIILSSDRLMNVHLTIHSKTFLNHTVTS